MTSTYRTFIPLLIRVEADSRTDASVEAAKVIDELRAAGLPTGMTLDAKAISQALYSGNMVQEGG